MIFNIAARALPCALVLVACDRGATTLHGPPGLTDPPPSPPPPTTATPPRAQPQPPPQTEARPPAGDPRTVYLYDWPATDRSELEQLLQRGDAVLLAGDGDDARLRAGCRGPFGGGAVYTFAAHPPRDEQTTTRNTALDIIYVGAWKAARTPRAADLGGDCSGVTHFVHTIDAGAFEYQSTTGTETHAEADLGGGVIGGKAATSSAYTSKSGDRSTCGPTPHPNCRAAVRLHLVPLAR